MGQCQPKKYQNISIIQHKNEIQESPPQSKKELKKIEPLICSDYIDEMSSDYDEQIQMMTSRKLNLDEYDLLEKNQETDNLYEEEIKVHWNKFIKMKKKNYLDDYFIIKEIGRGGFGKVNKVKNKYTAVLRAAKIIKKTALKKDQHQKLFAEMAIMTSLDHKNIVKLFQVYDYKNHYVLILQLCEGGELFKKILVSKELKEEYIAKIIKQILKALIYLKHKQVVHRDIKPQNMLFDKNSKTLKLIDFGIAFQREDDLPLTSRVGTAYYIAPEVILKRYNEQCDIWSTGIIMYMMMSRRPPFQGDTPEQLMENILTKDYHISQEMKKKFSKPCIDLLRRMLIKNPLQRIDVLAAYSHSWLNTVDENSIDVTDPNEVIDKIDNFKFKNKLEAVVFTYIVSQILTPLEKQSFVSIFEELDTNHDGVICKLEFRQALKKHVDMSEERLNFLMRIIDTNSSGYIDLTEFLVAGFKIKDILNEEHLEQAFAYFDIDHSGNISFEEIAFFLDDSKQSEESIKRIFKQIDENNDGVISKSQFVNLLMNKRQKTKLKKKTTIKKKE